MKWLDKATDVLFIAAALFCAVMLLRAVCGTAYSAEIPVQQTTCASHVISRRADTLWIELMCIVPPIKAGK